jgi:patatin-like phospholipase/acyl hydrolase
MTFNGGGIRGLLSLGLLRRLVTHQTGVDLIDSVSLFGGTSVGATIAASLAHNPTNASALDLYKSFQVTAPILYGGPNTRDPAKPKYHIGKLVELQEAVYKGKTLRELPKSVVLTTFNVGGRDKPWRPVLYSNVVRDDPIAGTPVAEAVVSSSAMPGMFGSYKGHVDGAFYNHDPSIAAIASAVHSGVRLEDIVLLDIGTGFMPQWIEDDTSEWGAFQWQFNDKQNTPALLLNGTKSPITSISLNGTSTNLMSGLAGMLLGDRCCSINPPIEFTPEDDWQRMDYLKRVADTHDLDMAFAFVEHVWFGKR